MAKVDVLGVKISTDPKSELLAQVKNYLESKAQKPLTIVTPNPEQLVAAQKDTHFKELLNSADIALPDGSGISWVINRRQKTEDNKQKLKTIQGIEFMEALVHLAVEKNYTIGFIGGRNGVAKEALEKLQVKFTSLRGWAENGPEVEVHSSQFIVHSRNDAKYFEEIFSKINKTKTQLLFVGLGAPKQELFLEKLLSTNYELRTMNLVLMVVGGSFDELSGKIPRPPQLISNLGLKWLWRLILEPWRIGRQLNLITFVQLILTHNNV